MNHFGALEFVFGGSLTCGLANKPIKIDALSSPNLEGALRKGPDMVFKIFCSNDWEYGQGGELVYMDYSSGGTYLPLS